MPALRKLAILGTPKDALLEANFHGVKLRTMMSARVATGSDDGPKAKLVPVVFSLTDADPDTLTRWFSEDIGVQPLAPGSLLFWTEPDEVV